MAKYQTRSRKERKKKERKRNGSTFNHSIKFSPGQGSEFLNAYLGNSYKKVTVTVPPISPGTTVDAFSLQHRETQAKKKYCRKQKPLHTKFCSENLINSSITAT
jgi:hypothetical protein